METVHKGKGLSDSVTLYIPTTTRVDQPLDAETVEEMVGKAQRFLSSLFGGTTSVRAQGTWLSASGELVKEDVILVSSHAANLAGEVLEEVLRFCVDLRDELKQEALAVEINGVLYLV